jgi:hypothetical protein
MKTIYWGCLEKRGIGALETAPDKGQPVIANLYLALSVCTNVPGQLLLVASKPFTRIKIKIKKEHSALSLCSGYYNSLFEKSIKSFNYLVEQSGALS